MPTWNLTREDDGSFPSLDAYQTDDQLFRNCTFHLHGSGINKRGGSKMYLSTQTSSSLIVKAWTTDSVQGLLLAVVLSVLISASLEMLKSYFLLMELRLVHHQLEKSRHWTYYLPRQLLHACLFGIRALIGYLLMFAVMTFNVSIVASVVFGSTVGYFVVNPIIHARMHMMMPTPKEQTREQMEELLSGVNGTNSLEMRPWSSGSNTKIFRPKGEHQKGGRILLHNNL